MKKIHVLIAEENLSTARFIMGNLNANEFDVSLAVGCNDALTKVKVEAPDMVILDIGTSEPERQPEADGLEVCRLIREWSEVPVIVLNSLQEAKSRCRFLHEGRMIISPNL